MSSGYAQKVSVMVCPAPDFFAAPCATSKKYTPPAQAQPSALSASNTLISTTPTPSSAPSVEQYMSTDKLSIRDRPGGKVISKLKRGDKVQVFETRNDWVGA